MSKYRVSTTISAKHWELLKKHTAKFATQQKVLEAALESLENHSKQNNALTPEKEIWMRLGTEAKSACSIQRDFLKLLIENANFDWLPAYLASQKPMEYVLESYYQRSLKKCSLREIMDGIILNFRASNWFDTVDYVENDDHYSFAISHSLTLKSSELMLPSLESLFKTYGVRTESEISERGIFMKIYKKS